MFTEGGVSGITWHEDGPSAAREAERWMAYLIDHFLKPGCSAAGELPFLRADHVCNGRIQCQGEDPDDLWAIEVRDNGVRTMVADRVWREAHTLPGWREIEDGDEPEVPGMMVDGGGYMREVRVRFPRPRG